MFGTRKGQGATEYLVLLAVVLIIALVSIALLGFFPGLAGDARKTQSDSYWRGEAMPFHVLEHSCTSAGVLTLIVQNAEAEKRVMTGVLTNGTTAVNSTTGTFAGGAKKTITATGVCGAVGNTYDVDINFTYTTSGITTNQTQVGTKTLIGTVS